MTRTKQIIVWSASRILLAFLVMNIALSPAAYAELTYEQQEAIWKDFSNWDKAAGVSSKAFQELMGNDATKQLFEDYGNSVMIVQVSKELVYSGDLAAAATIIKDKLQDKVIEHITPGFHSWLGWITWAKTGMELFKDIIFDPMVESSQIDTYNGLRKAGNDPEIAWAGVRGYGYIVERAKKEFRKHYGDLPFQAGTNDLLPKWEANFLTFAKANMETQYLEALHKEVVAKFMAEAQVEQTKLAAHREQLLKMLGQMKVGRIDLDPPTAELHVGEQVIFSAIAVYEDPSSPRSAEDVTGECAWTGGTSDNVFRAEASDAGKTITVSAEYAGITGTATVKVVGTDCGEHGQWNTTAGKCDCDSGYVWNEDLFECVGEERAEGEAEEVLNEMEYRFYDAVKVFDEHYDNFVAGLKAHAGSPAEDICADANLAYSFTQAALAYELVESYYFEALDLVGRGDRGLNWEAIAAGNYESDISVLDQIRLEMFRKDRARVQEQGESLPVLLAEYAPGCDPEDVLDRGARTAEPDQDAETGIDGTDVAGGGTPGGGGGELRWERTGQPVIQTDFNASCSGGSLTLSVDTPNLPDVLRPGESITVSVSFSWSSSGSGIDDIGVGSAVFFGADATEGPEYHTFSGSHTDRFTFTMPQSYDIAFSISINIGGGILCDGGSSDGVGYGYTVAYFRKGGE